MSSMAANRAPRNFKRLKKGRRDSIDEFISVDYKKTTIDNFRELLEGIARLTVGKNRKLACLNAFTRYVARLPIYTSFGYSYTEILTCVQISLCHEAKEIRTACLRAIRYLCRNTEAIKVLIELNIDYLIVRSLDICLDNDIERIHALRLMRKIMLTSPNLMPSSFVRCIISIANYEGVNNSNRDKMINVCLATICELCYINAQLAVSHSSISILLKAAIDCTDASRNEALISTILYLLNKPSTREYVIENCDLEFIFSTFTDHTVAGVNQNDHLGDSWENRFNGTKLAISTIIKSWPGFIRICVPNGNGLKSLLGVLRLPSCSVKKEIIDVLYNVFRLQVPVWTSNFNEALASVDSSQKRDSYRLSEGFVGQEGKIILPNLAKSRPNLVYNHIAIVMSTFLEAGLLETLVEVITSKSSDDEISIRASILLGQIIHLTNRLLPWEIAQYSHCLPSLVNMISSPNIGADQRNRANAAVKCLDRLHTIKQRGPVPYSLYLEAIVQRSSISGGNEDIFKKLRLNTEKQLSSYLDKNADHDVISQAIRESGVISFKEYEVWNWKIILSVLKWPDEELRKLEDEANKKFIRRVIQYFRPTSRNFSTKLMTDPDERLLALVGCHLVDFLLESDDIEGRHFAEEWLDDIAFCIDEVKLPQVTTTLTFSPDNLCKTLSQYYFLFIGRFSSNLKGERLLKEQGIFHSLLDLMTISQHDTYVKLIVSTLDYSRDGFARVILSRGLTATSESARLYITTFMRVLLRARSPFFSSWGIEKLVQQICDQSRPVVMEALSVLNEACEEQVNINNLVTHKPAVLHLGSKGQLLLARFLSVPTGFQYLTEINYVESELEKWHTIFNLKYVQIVEDYLNDALMVFERSDDGIFQRRSQKKKPQYDAYVPVHIYGELVQHKIGFDLLNKKSYLIDYIHLIKLGSIRNDEEILRLKAALWAIGHVCTSVWGVSLVKQYDTVFDIIHLAEECSVYSIRGTAFYVLGLVATTSKGVSLLETGNWQAIRHKANDLWPIIEKRTVRNILETQNENPSIASSLSAASEKSLNNLPVNATTGISQNDDSGHGSVIKPAGFYIDSDHQKSHSVPVQVKILESSPTGEYPANRCSAPVTFSHTTSGFSSQEESPSPSLSPQSSFIKRQRSKKFRSPSTTADDEEGYATLRYLRNIRDNTLEDEIMPDVFFDEGVIRPDIKHKRLSSGAPSSAVSVSSFDGATTTAIDQISTRSENTSSGRAEYIGIALPIDINMILEDNSNSLKSNKKFQGISSNGHRNSLISCTTDLHQHVSKNCLNCLDQIQCDEIIENMPASTQLTEDTAVGRCLIRKECLRLIISLSSSVGAKKVSEPGLLQLKQKFRSTFESLCLYSDVCYLLANYNYRINSRRFIQELFLDVKFNILEQRANLILNFHGNNQPTRSDSFNSPQFALVENKDENI